MKEQKKIPAFSAIVIFVMLMIIGLSLLPLLNVQLNPTTSLPRTNVSFGWSNASARVVEQEVTSVIEGVVGQVKGIKRISSVSKKGGGNISIEFKKGINRDMVRFEISTLIRHLYPQLPEGVSYPTIQMNSTDNQNKGPVLTYTLNASASPMYIQQYAEKNIANKLSLVKGIKDVMVYGGTPYEWEITFDSKKIETLGIKASDISSAINNHFKRYVLGVADMAEWNSETAKPVRVVLEQASTNGDNWQNVPIKKVGNRMIWLNNIAKVQYKEQPPRSYHRINGLNTINMVVYPDDEVNNIRLAKMIKEEVALLQQQLPKGYSMLLAYDATEFIEGELNKIGLRTLFSLLILFVFVLIVSRKWRYLFLILTSIVANLLIACIFYYLFKVEIHLYAMAGITVSFGMLIDNSIIMIDHIRYRGNRKIFIAILAATLTTIGALSVIFFLKEQQKVNLVDFAMVIMINLSVSMLVALFFIPALFEKLPIKVVYNKRNIRRKRRVAKLNRFYIRSIRFSKRLNWLYVLLFILGFGLPVHWLPDTIKKDTFPAKMYNKTLGADWFKDDVKPIMEKVVGGSFRLFTQNVYEKSFYSEPGRTVLYVQGKMPEGCTIDQLNVAVKKMENMIGGFDEVSMYQTQISSAQNGRITIFFNEEDEFSGFPYYLKEELTSKANQLGGLDWTVYGVGRGFSNALHTGSQNQRITLEGYNYDQLYAFAEQLGENLETNPRVKDLEIKGSTDWRAESLYEYYLEYDPELFVLNDVSPSQFYSYLNNKLFRNRISSVYFDGDMQQMTMVSSEFDYFNVWSLNNEPISIGEKKLKLSSLGSIEKRKTGNSIHKNNQQYQLVVAFNFIGSYQLAKMVKDEHIEHLEKELPLGYRVIEQSYWYGWSKKDNKQYWLILLVIGIIYFICSILLESFRQPLAIIGMIPVSFIGVFLTFYLFDFNFDQGGFASFILLCGIVVNAGLYIINDFNETRKNNRKKPRLQLYVKSFHHKIIPIVLTILSTVLGLVPFVWQGQNEVFWFSFAVGSMGGLLFSIIALVVYLPVFMRLGVRRRNG